MGAQIGRVARGGAMVAANAQGFDDEASLAGDADWQAWVDARVAAAIEAQDDAELMARRFGPEPEFMLPMGGGRHAC